MSTEQINETIKSTPTMNNQSSPPKPTEYDVEGPLTLDESKIVDNNSYDSKESSPRRLVVGEEEMKNVDEHKHVEFILPDDFPEKDTRTISVIDKRNILEPESEEESAMKKFKNDITDFFSPKEKESSDDSSEDTEEEIKKKESVIKMLKHKISHVFSKDEEVESTDSNEEVNETELVNEIVEEEPEKKRSSTIKKIKSRISGMFSSEDDNKDKEDDEKNSEGITEEMNIGSENSDENKIDEVNDVEEDEENSKKKKTSILKKIKSKISDIFHSDEDKNADVTETLTEDKNADVTETLTEDKIDDVTETLTEDKIDDVTETLTEDKIADVTETLTEDKIADVTETLTEDINADVTETLTEDKNADTTETLTEDINESVKKRSSVIKSIKSRITDIFKSDNKEENITTISSEPIEESIDSVELEDHHSIIDDVKEDTTEIEEPISEEKRTSIMKKFKNRVSSIISLKKEEESLSSKESLTLEHQSPETKIESSLTLEEEEEIKKESVMKRLQHQITGIFIKHKDETDVTKEVSTEVMITPEATEEVKLAVTDEISDKVTEEVTEEISDKVTEDVTLAVTEKILSDVTEEVTEEVTGEVSSDVTEEVTEEDEQDKDKSPSMLKKIKNKIHNFISPEKKEVLTEESLNEILNGSSEEITNADAIASVTSIKSNSSIKKEKTGIFDTLMDKIKGNSNEEETIIVDEETIEEEASSEEVKHKEEEEENTDQEIPQSETEDVPINVTASNSHNNETVRTGFLCWTFQQDAIPSADAEILRWGEIYKRTDLRRSYKISYGRIMSDGIWQWSKDDQFTSPHGLYLKSNMTLKIIKKREKSNKTPYILKVIVPWGKKDDDEKTIVNLAFRTVEERQPWINTFLQVKQKLIKEEKI